MSVTDGDREKARQAVFPGYVADRIELVAAALAAERERARAPFLALADELERGSTSVYTRHAVERIRRAVEES